MDPVVGSALVSAGADLLGGLLGGKTSKKSQVGLARNMSTVQLDHDKASALNRPSWIVEGANKAGISPLVAMGLQPSSVPSISVGDDGGGMASAMSSMGQNLGRAAEAYLSRDQRAKMEVRDGLALERAKLENDLLRSQISSVNRTAGTPGLPSSSGYFAGQGDAGGVSVVPDEVIAKAKGDPSTRAGKHAAFQEYDVGNGHKISLPVSDGGIGEALEGLPWPYAYAKMGELLYKRYENYTPGYWIGRAIHGR